ncbi:MAG: hypothetical protein CMH83_19495 [Nocardioides sp.]|nr:hypothetical protein [Nocardioides sp.]
MPRSHVTRREAAAICTYAAALCPLLRMPAWRILVMEDPADDATNASIDWIDQRHVARLCGSRRGG